MSGILSKYTSTGGGPGGPGGLGSYRSHPSSSELKSFLLSLLRIGIVGLGSFYLVKYLLTYADPSYNERKKAKVKADQLTRKLGLKGLSLNEHEIMIATHLVDPSNLQSSWSDVAGLDEQIEEIKKTVIYPVLAQKNNLRVSRLVQPPKGVLLYGPPGCGKTLIAKCMAKEARCWFINLDVSVLTDKWYGESQKLTAAVFSLAEKLQPCIIFIDEIDSLLRLRSGQDHECTAMMKAQFMSLWDGLITDPKKTVILMGATNRQRDMDFAILRRMAAKFHIPLPDEEMRKRILDLTLKNEVVGKDFDMDKLAKMTDGFSGSDLKEVARSAAVACLSDFQFGKGGSGEGATLNIKSGSNTSLDRNPSTESAGGGGGGWLEIINPFASESNKNKKTPQTPTSSSSLGLRPIKMRDFQQAVAKLKESRRDCGLGRQRFELD